MSAIAQFHVVPGDRLAEVLAAAAPQRRGWFRAAHDSFRQVLRGAGRELETFAWSGWVFNTLDLYLESRHGLMYGSSGDSAASRQLSAARGSYWLVLPQGGAAELLAALESIKLDSGDLTAFIAAEHGPAADPDEVTAVQAALTTLKAWLAQVPPQWVGLLSVG